jgi:DNA-directed RNA polymerase subunit RPC12/RpoP
MTIGKVRGLNTSGHRGWFTVYCRICGRPLDLTKDVVYACPTCKDKYEAYFCSADARRVGYKCPFCGKQLEIVSVIK